jgi:hypothetical protein
MTTPECISAVSDIVIALAASVTAVVAVRGLGTWSEQLKGTAHFEVARCLARATYKLRDEISNFRSPVIHGSEFPDGGHTGANAYAHVLAARWKPISESVQEFDAQSLEAEALWGEEVRAKTDALKHLVWKLRIAIESFVQNERNGGENFKCDPNFAISTRSQVFASPNATDNKLSNEIAAAIAAIEEALKPHLRRQRIAQRLK